MHSSDKPSRVEGNLLLNSLMGATVRFIGPVDEKTRGLAAERTVEELKGQERSPYLIGDSTTGALGYLHGVLELYEQQLEQKINIEHVFIPGSMGTTEAGLIVGNALLGHPFDVHIISVEYGIEELSARIKAIFDNAVKKMDPPL